MLRKIVEEELFLFADKVDSWQDAIRLGCKPLEVDGAVDQTYADQIIDCVEKYGPYIVIIPGVAMPHTQENATGVSKTNIAFLKLEEAISFDEADDEKSAKLFFTLASCNHEEHLKNIQSLAAMLMNEQLVAELMEAKSARDLLALQKKYLD